MIPEDKLLFRCKDIALYKRMFADAGLHAIHETLAAGLPVTHLEKNQIVKEWPDGRREILGELPPVVPLKRKKYPWKPE